MYGKSKLYFSNISLVGAESAPTFTIWGRKAPPRIQKWLHFTPPFFEIWNLNKITMKSEHKKRRRKAQINFARNIGKRNRCKDGIYSGSVVKTKI